MGRGSDVLGSPAPSSKGKSAAFILVAALLLVCLSNLLQGLPPLQKYGFDSGPVLNSHQKKILQASIDRCNSIKTPAGPPPNFDKRTRSDRAIEGSSPILIKNVTLWTGKPEEGDAFGEVLSEVDISIADGIIKSIQRSGSIDIEQEGKLTVIDGQGRWMTPGIIDVHIHAGLDVLPALRGLEDTNSLKSPTSPYLRSIDGVSNHDWSFVSIASGGVTTGLALPGSADNVGGQAFPIKLGRLGKKAVSEGGWTRLIDTPRSLILPGEGKVGRDALYDESTGMKRRDGSSSFRYMKMACGENDRRVYRETRMDEAKNFRQLFYNARELMQKQDDFCEKVKRGSSSVTSGQVTFPDDFLLEAVVDVLRGKTKVNTHCYTLEDFSSFASHTNEFKFPLAAFHHAHEAYLAPGLLNKVYGDTPAIAMFSLNANYKTEAYFGSPFAAAILSSHNITTLTKSDHPVTDSRRLMSQVAQMHHFGLSAGKALRGVTSSAAKVLGLDHRIGQAKEGFDADLVLWDMNPLSLGAKPVEVIIDGARQKLSISDKYAPLHDDPTHGIATVKTPLSANYSAEIKRVKNSGPEIMAWESSGFPIAKRRAARVKLYNVSQVYIVGGEDGDEFISSFKPAVTEAVYLSGGKVVCTGDDLSCPGSIDEEIHLKGGVVIPGLLAFGSPLGMADIVAEPATRDGDVSQSSPIAFASDAIRLGGNDLRFAHSLGVTSVVSAPEADVGLMQGVATHFDTGAEDILKAGAIRKERVALHLSNDHWQASDSSQPTMGQQIASIRNSIVKAEEAIRKGILADEESTADKHIWIDVANGTLPLIVQVHQAETISRLILIKEAHPNVKLILRSADEASFGSIPSRLKKADIPVLIRPIEWPQIYDARRALKLGGIQASQNKQKSSSLLGVLLDAGVRVGFTIDESWQATTLLWDAVAAGREAGISDEESLRLATIG